MATWKEITEKEFYEKYGDYKIRFYSYGKNQFIFGTDKEDEKDIDLTVNIFDNKGNSKLLIYQYEKYKVSDLKDFIWGANIYSKEKRYMIEIYDK